MKIQLVTLNNFQYLTTHAEKTTFSFFLILFFLYLEQKTSLSLIEGTIISVYDFLKN